MKRTATDAERALFLAALSGRLPPKRPKTKTSRGKAAKKTAGPATPSSGGRRLVSRDEEELFLATISGQSPVKPKPPAKTKEPVTPPPPKAPQTLTGLDGNTLRRLTRGELKPTAKLDLHGLTEAGAHGTLTAFLMAAHHRGDRLVLVVTGKGSGKQVERARGVLRTMVPRWLEEAPMAKLIADKRWAHRRHGGEGALYIYLRKHKA